MKELAESFVKQVTELRKEIVKASIESEVFDHMSGKEFELMNKTFKLLDTSLELTVKQAMTIEEMNKKLDTLLTRTEGA